MQKEPLVIIAERELGQWYPFDVLRPWEFFVILIREKKKRSATAGRLSRAASAYSARHEVELTVRIKPWGVECWMVENGWREKGGLWAGDVPGMPEALPPTPMYVPRAKEE